LFSLVWKSNSDLPRLNAARTGRTRLPDARHSLLPRGMNYGRVYGNLPSIPLDSFLIPHSENLQKFVLPASASALSLPIRKT
jgi:hypothetical protein